MLPRVKKIDSASMNVINSVKLAKIGWDFLDEIKPLLEHLQPILDQMKVIFINDLYDQLPEDQRPSECGELIPDDKLSKTDPNIFLIQKCYNLACFLLNQLIPEIKKCWTNAGIIALINNQQENFEKHFTFSVAEADTTASPETDSGKIAVDAEASTPLTITQEESLKVFTKIAQPFLNIIEKFLGNIPKVIVPLISFVTLLLKETTQFTRLSLTLADSLNAPLVTGDLSYYAGCYIYDAMRTLGYSLGALNDSLQEAANKDKENNDTLSEEQKSIWLLSSYLIPSGRLINFYFGNRDRNSRSLDSDIAEKSEGVQFLSFVTEEAKQIPIKLNELTDQWKILEKEMQNFLNNPNQKPPFVPKEVQEVVIKLHGLVFQASALEQELNQFSQDHPLTPETCEYPNMEVALNNLQQKQKALQQNIEKFSADVNALPETEFIYFSKWGDIQTWNYSNLKEVLSLSEELAKFTKSTAETLRQLKANNRHINTAYENLWASVIQPAQDFLAERKSDSYQFAYHSQAHRLLAILKKEPFTKPTVSSLPYPGVDPEKYAEILDASHQVYETSRQGLIQNLEQELVKQKTYFNQYLKATIAQKLADLNREMPKKQENLIDAFKGLAKESGEIIYIEVLKDTEDWLAKITIKQLVLTTLDPLKLTNPDLVKPWVDEFSSAEHQQLFNSIEKLKTPLMQMIETQRMELNATNQKEIERLQSEIEDYQTKQELCSKIFDTIETLKQQQQQEKEALQKNYQEPNQSIQETIKKANAEAATLNLAPISLGPDKRSLADVKQAVEYLSDQLYNKRLLYKLKRQVNTAKTTEDIQKISDYATEKLTKNLPEYIKLSLEILIDKLQKGINNDTKVAAILILDTALTELSLEKSKRLIFWTVSTRDAARSLHQLLKTLNQAISEQSEEATKVIETLNVQHETSLTATYEELYAGILKENWPLTPEIYLETLKKAQQLKQLQLDFAALKVALNENHATLKQINKSVEEKLVPNVVFNQPGVLTSEQWSNHYQTSVKQLSAAQAKYWGDKNALSRAEAIFKQLLQKTQILGEQIASLAQNASPEVSIRVNALSSLRKGIQKQGGILAKEYTAVQSKLKEKTENLQKARKLLVEENKQADLFNQQLTAVNHIQKRLNLRLGQVQARSHPLVNNILDGTRKNPVCILTEDQFYENTNQFIVILKAQLNKLEKNKIQKETPLSTLESAFSQALAAKITVARTAIANLQTSYQTKKQEWASYSTENFLLQRSRQITNTSNKVSDTLTDCQGWSLERIQLADKDFRDVAMRYAYLNHAELQRCDFSGIALEGVHFGGADIQTCQFENANFKKVILDEQTQFNWGAYGQKVLFDNLSDPYSSPSEIYLHRLVEVAAQKSPETISADLILNLLEQTKQTEQPADITEKAHRIAQQNHAVSIVNHLVPRLASIDEVLKLKVLVENKYKEDEKNPYRFIRQELDLFRFKYGNTHAWEQIMTCIKTKLQELAKDARLDELQYQYGETIMKTHVKHDYGFGFFYTPEIAHEWGKTHKSNTLKLEGRA